MIRSSRSALPLRGLAIAAAAALIPAIAGCEAGLNAPTQQWHQPTAGLTKTVADTIHISNMFILGPPPGTSLQPGSSTGVFFALSNRGDADRLIGMSAPGAAGTVSLPGGGVPIARQQTVLLTGPAPKVVLEDLTRPVNGGQFIWMTLDFQNAGAVTVPVPVMPKAQYYTTFSPVPSPSPTPSPTGPSRRHHHRASATPSPSATPAP